MSDSSTELERKVAQLTRELAESRKQQTATADVLKVISSSTFDLDTVLTTLIQTAIDLCQATRGVIWLRRGQQLFLSAHVNYSDEWVTFARNNPLTPAPDAVTTSGLAAFTGEIVHVEDVPNDPRFRSLAAHKLGDYRAGLAVPLKRGDQVVGVISVSRPEARLFTDQQVALVQTFADQAVIAIENARLFNEIESRNRTISEALDQQTATSNILGVIASSPGDVTPVLEAIAESAARLCQAFDAIVRVREGDSLVFGAHYGPIPVDPAPWAISRKWTGGRSVVDRATIHVHDLADAAEEYPEGSAMAHRFGHRTTLAVPLLREGEAIGTMMLRRMEVKPFSEAQISVLRTFADQAVIAIENARLFEEVRSRNRDLAETLEQQVATSAILSAIAASPTNIQPVLDAVTESAAQLIDAYDTTIFLRREDVLDVASHRGAAIRIDFDHLPLRRDVVTSRAVLDRKTIHVHDLMAEGDEYPTGQALARQMGFRTTLSTPLMREGEAIGALMIRRTEVRPFSDRQVQLLKTFADQAVIAIENVRLFEEVQARTAELSESLQQQTATADVLKVISRSAFDLPSVLQTLVDSAVRLCGADMGAITMREDDSLQFMAGSGQSPELRAYEMTHPHPLSRGTFQGRAAVEGKTIHIPNVLEDAEYERREATKHFGAVLSVPLKRGAEVIGVFGLARRTVGPFGPRQIELVENFADQAVIAIENVRLFDEVQARTRDLSRSLEELQNAQDRLVQTEKLASLGQLTAGIAHEIKNPLNFVNNFSALSAELVGELQEILGRAPLTGQMKSEIDELSGMLKGNLEKVTHHGKRADSIVKNMLLHSRQGSGEHRPSDINAIVEESLNLAYHGARAEKNGFSITLEKSLDPAAGEVDIYPQEITRVLINLISNGFYATSKRSAESNGVAYEPVLAATTRNLGDSVEIRIRDNGTGIPPEVKEKMFSPFFTTKPAGEGTGLGLSLSHDIIVKQHAGTIEVESEHGAFTEFRIILPRAGGALAQ